MVEVDRVMTEIPGYLAKAREAFVRSQENNARSYALNDRNDLITPEGAQTGNSVVNVVYRVTPTEEKRYRPGTRYQSPETVPFVILRSPRGFAELATDAGYPRAGWVRRHEEVFAIDDVHMALTRGSFVVIATLPAPGGAS